MSFIRIEERSLNNGISVITQAKLKKPVPCVCIRMTDEIKLLLKEKCSGALDVSIMGLIKYGLDKLEERNICISMVHDKDGFCLIERKKDKEDNVIKVNYKISRINSKSFSLRMDDELRQRIKKATGHGSYTVAILGIIKYSLSLLEDLKKTLIIKNSI